jgi:hypothetical protein
VSFSMDEISPAEIVADMLNRYGDPEIAPAGIVIGPSNHAQQQAGVVSITAAGMPVVNKYLPLQSMRAQIRCLAGTLELAEAIAQAVLRDTNGKVRMRCRQASTDQWYLVHLSNVTAGPSMHYDSAETWETLLFAELLIGTGPVGVPGSS